MRIMLLAQRLQFVSWATGTVHAQDMRTTASVMCGKPIPLNAEIRPQRELSSNVLCGRCVASLRTYTGRMGTTAMVRFDGSEVAR